MSCSPERRLTQSGIAHGCRDASRRRLRYGPASGEVGARLLEELAFMVLAFFADVERAHRPVVAHNPGPYLARLPFVVGKGNRVTHRMLLVIHGLLLMNVQRKKESFVLNALRSFAVHAVAAAFGSSTI